MKTIPVLLILNLALMPVLSGCTQPSNTSGASTPAPTSPLVTTPGSGIANPASVFCAEKGYRNEIRKNPDGSEYGVCIFPGGTECEEWAFYRGTCNETTAGRQLKD